MSQINVKDVAARYNSIQQVWDSKDLWHTYTKDQIGRFIERFAHGELNERSQILNAGSAGFSYGLPESNMLHVDVASKKIMQCGNFIVADIHNIPIGEKKFQLILCVGSVLNYCDPIVVLKEFERLIVPDGSLVLEFENSHTFELYGKNCFNRKAVLVNSFYNQTTEKLWYFSETYISELLKSYGFQIVKTRRFHIISPLIYRLSKNEKFASRFAKWDIFFSKIPLINKFASNTILLARKTNAYN